MRPEFSGAVRQCVQFVREDRLDPYIYVYGIGGIVYAAGLWVAWQHGYLGLRGRGLIHLVGCVLVLGFFATIQGYLEYAPLSQADPQPYRGTADHLIETGHRMRGAPLDYGIMVAYFVAILAVGTWFGRRQKTARDFFFGGQRFSWWLITFSLIATTIGSYSFVKYSSMGFKYGLPSTQTYFNDWIWFPLLAFGWLPILYFSRITSIPEYFGRRFNPTVRLWATMVLLIYLVGYIGVNLYTMGRVLEGLLGWNVFLSALLVGVISMTYVTVGGQTSVIMTDLFQGGHRRADPLFGRRLSGRHGWALGQSSSSPATRICQLQ
jgi:solute:Na+ symporter, SSS family